MPTPSVLTIQHMSAEPLGTLGDSLSSAGIALRSVRIDRGEAVSRAMAGANGLVIMGGSMGVYEADRYPFLRDELRLIEDALRLNVPVLGICLGAQLLAAALGSRVFPAGVKEIGWYPVAVNTVAHDDPLFARAPDAFTAFHWHGDTFDLPAGATRLASSAITREQGFRHGKTWGVQFHLEVTEQVVSAMMVGADAELAAEGVSGAEVTGGCANHGAALEAIAHSVFGAWARLVVEEAG